MTTFSYTNDWYKKEILKRIDELREWNKNSEAPAMIKNNYEDYLSETRSKVCTFANAIPDSVPLRDTVLGDIAQDLSTQKKIAVDLDKPELEQLSLGI